MERARFMRKNMLKILRADLKFKILKHFIYNLNNRLPPWDQVFARHFVTMDRKYKVTINVEMLSPTSHFINIE